MKQSCNFIIFCAGYVYCSATTLPLLFSVKFFFLSSERKINPLFSLLDGGQPRSDICITELAYLLVFINVIKYVCTLDYDSEMRDLKVGNKEQLKAISGSFLPFRTKLRGK